MPSSVPIITDAEIKSNIDSESLEEYRAIALKVLGEEMFQISSFVPYDNSIFGQVIKFELDAIDDDMKGNPYYIMVWREKGTDKFATYIFGLR